MSELSAYKGDKPYIFVSYAHKDSSVVRPLIQALQDVGYRIWFDLGIEVGTEWSNNIAQHLRECSGFLFFASKNSVQSENCLDEVAYAKSHNKQAVLIFLEEDVELPAGTEMQTARFQRMYVNRQDSVDGFVKNFSAGEVFDICRAAEEPVEESPQKPQVIPPVKTKKKSFKGLLIGIAAGIAAILIATAVFLFGGLGKDSGELTLSDSLSDHTFRLEGVVYKLPVEYQELTKDGWTIGSRSFDTESYIGGRAKEFATLVKDGKQIDVTFYNDEENAKQLKNCKIGQVCVYRHQAETVDFCIASGITVTSTEAEMIEAFGPPSEKNEFVYSTLCWNQSEQAAVEVALHGGDEDEREYDSITINNYAYSQTPAQIVETAPKYLDNYVAPETLGEDRMSAILSVGEDLYELPVPLREFLENGWTVSSGSGYIISGETEYLELSKDGAKLWVEVANLSAYKTTPQNCVVVQVNAEADDGASISLPGGIRMGMAEEDLKTKLPEEVEFYEGYSSNSYNYSDYDDRDYSVSIYVDAETKVVNSVRIRNMVYGIIVEE